MDFVSDFINWIRRGKITDSPDLFLETTALQILSMTIGRTFYTYFGRKKIYSNMWAILIGKSSMFRKSTCLDLAKSFIDDDLLFPDEYSSERLIETIAYKGKGIMTVDELMSVSKLWNREYASGVKSFLTQLFDSDRSYKRETMEYKVEIKEPYINIFACSTPIWFQSALNEEDIYGGFLPRFLLVYCWKKKYNYKFPGRGDIETEKVLRHHLDLLKNTTKTPPYELKLSEIAIKHFTKYTNLIEKLIHQEGNGLSPFLTRLLTYVIKTSILYHFSDSRNLYDREISAYSMKRAISYIDKIRITTEKILSRLSFSSFQVLRNKILELLENKGEIKYSELLRKLRIPTKQLNDILRTLQDEEIIERKIVSTDTKPCEIIKINQEILNREKTIS